MQLQRALNAIGGKLEEDGVIGPLTLDNVAAAWAVNIWRVVAAVEMQRVEWYSTIINRDKSQLVFISGWLKRTIRNARVAGI